MQSATGPGRVVAGRYQLLDPVGHGAMGTVWRARDLRLDRDVAVKEVRVLGPMTSQDRNVLRERSLREARVAARLNHPGVVTVHDVIEADGTPWIIMELVPSRSLAQVLAQDGPMPPARAALMGMTLLEALGSAHASGVVHRDVKPGNILITAEGRAVLTDFGIATLHGDPGLTQAGMVMGTPGFCAPERIRGEPASPASDLWSLGATLYAAVEGRNPFEGQGSAMAVLANIVHGDPPPATSAGPLLCPVITALMRRDPAARPDATAARCLLAAACRSYAAQTGGNANGASAPAGTWDGAVAPSGARARDGAGARDGAAATSGAWARDGARAQDGAAVTSGARARDGAGAGRERPAGAGGILDEPGIRGGARGPDSTLAFPLTPPEGVASATVHPSATVHRSVHRSAHPSAAAEPVRPTAAAAAGAGAGPAGAALAGASQAGASQAGASQAGASQAGADFAATVTAQPPADIAAPTGPAAPAGPAAPGGQSAQSGQPGQGGQRRRPGRHRRALLFGGGGTAVVLAALLVMLGLAHAARLSPRWGDGWPNSGRAASNAGVHRDTSTNLSPAHERRRHRASRRAT